MLFLKEAPKKEPHNQCNKIETHEFYKFCTKSICWRQIKTRCKGHHPYPK
jgi:hypothetical protein